MVSCLVFSAADIGRFGFLVRSTHGIRRSREPGFVATDEADLHVYRRAGAKFGDQPRLPLAMIVFNVGRSGAL
jgi:hypothetical protein